MEFHEGQEVTIMIKPDGTYINGLRLMPTTILIVLDKEEQETATIAEAISAIKYVNQRLEKFEHGDSRGYPSLFP